jgi:hypothetical protein
MAYGVNAPFGLQSRFTLTSSSLSGQQNEYAIASGYATGLYSGDPIAFLGDGTIGICPAGTPAIGVFGGVKFTDTLGNYYTQSFWPASQATLGSQPAIAYIIDDPNVEFDIQVSNSQNVANPAITAAQIGKNANFAIGGGGGNIVPANPTSGSTRTGLSGYYLDFSTIGTDSTLSLKIVRFTPAIGNAASIPFNNVIVTLNDHVFKSTGVGTNIDSLKITAVSANYTALLSDEVIDVTTSGGAITITLPAATTTNATGKKYVIKDVSGNAGTNNITVNGGGTNIDGAATSVINSNYGKLTVFSNGTQWFTV